VARPRAADHQADRVCPVRSGLLGATRGHQRCLGIIDRNLGSRWTTCAQCDWRRRASRRGSGRNRTCSRGGSVTPPAVITLGESMILLYPRNVDASLSETEELVV